MRFIKLTKLTKDLSVYLNVIYITQIQSVEEEIYNEDKQKNITVKYSRIVAASGGGASESILVKETAEEIIDLVNKSLQTNVSN